MSFTTPIHTNEQSIDRVLGAGLPVLLVFWRSRECVPCEQIKPALDRLAAVLAGKILIARVDAPSNPQLVARYGVQHLPGLLFLSDGEVVARASGTVSEQALQAWLEALLAGRSAGTLQGTSVPIGGATPRSDEPRSAPSTPASKPSSGDGRPIVLSDRTWEQQVLRSERPVLVDFWAPWCGPCRMIAPSVEQLAREFAGRAVVGKLNIDENPHTQRRYGIMSIPAIFVFHHGKAVEQLVGARPVGALREALAKYCPPA